MIKSFTCLFLLAISVATACKKHALPFGNQTQPLGNPSIVGKWTIVSVTTFFYDSTGLLNPGGQVYPGQLYSYFQFNSDKSWLESLVPDSLSVLGITGTYEVTSDSTFTMSNPKAVPQDTHCSILALTDTNFSFSHQRSTAFNGTDPGFIKYVFLLRK